MECKKQENSKKCPCTWSNCPRKGVCCECLEYHLAREEVPACFFSEEQEKTYDRSIGNFIKNYKQNE